VTETSLRGAHLYWVVLLWRGLEERCLSLTLTDFSDGAIDECCQNTDRDLFWGAPCGCILCNYMLHKNAPTCVASPHVAVGMSATVALIVSVAVQVLGLWPFAPVLG